MARLATRTEAASRGEERPPTFEDIPARLRPSAWQNWSSQVTPEMVEAEFGEACGISDHYRKVMIAERMRSDAYTEWLAEHDLLSKLGQPIRGWDSVTVARWQEALDEGAE